MSRTNRLAELSLNAPRAVTGVMVGVTLLLAAIAALPTIWPRTFTAFNPATVDTDPENMLDEDEPIRVFHDHMKETFNLYDMVVVGVVNEEHPEGVFNPLSLARVYELTQLARTMSWPDPNDPSTPAGVVQTDMISPSTVDSIEPSPAGVSFSVLMRTPPTTPEAAQDIRRQAMRVPFLEGTMVSETGQAVAVYLPLTAKGHSHKVYTTLNEHLPMLWRFAAVRLQWDQLPGLTPVGRNAAIQLGRLVAQQAEDADALRAGLGRVADLAGAGSQSDWQAAIGRIDSFAGWAETLDAEHTADEPGEPWLARIDATGQFRRDLAESLAGGSDADWLTGLYVQTLSASTDATDMLESARQFAQRMGDGLADLPDGAGEQLASAVEVGLDDAGDVPGPDRWYITGLPVAEDTFGVEMFVQMAISAPTAMAVIFILMLVFFRKLVLIISPMIVAMVSVIVTMASLIISGNPVHIMSSMIPIFIMPIAVLDSIHILSEFFERYQQTHDRRKTIHSVMAALFTPMLYTSLTSAAGFASLALTPIPPVQVFGLFVAMGIMVAWLLTILFIPAYVMLLPESKLEGFGAKHVEGEAAPHTPLARLLRWTGAMTFRRAKPILAVAMIVLVVAGYGITQININDNPVMWFHPGHPIRVADRVLNRHFGGTYMAYLAMNYQPEPYQPGTYAQTLMTEADARASAAREALDVLAAQARQLELPEAEDHWTVLDELDAAWRDRKQQMLAPAQAGQYAPADFAAWDLANQFLGSEYDRDAPDGDFDPGAFAAALADRAEAHGRSLAEAIGGLDPLVEDVAAVRPESREAFLDRLIERVDSDQAPVAEHRQAVVLLIDQQRTAEQVFKRPAALRWMLDLQQHMTTITGAGDAALVGKSNSLADIVRTVNRDFHGGRAEYDRIPNSADGVAQMLLQFQNSNRKDDLWHFATRDYDQASIWVQLRSGDNQDMSRVARSVGEWVDRNPAPAAIETNWFGLTYINVIWQDKMVVGMLQAFAGSFLIVLVMMTILFRSALWGLLSMIPLTVTIAAIYGTVGLVGKDYDMPTAVLSSLTLGLAIDFAIHFLARSRTMHAEYGSWQQTAPAVFGEPARAIVRNILVIAIGFTPLLLAPLMPYRTVGLLLASILAVSGIATLLLLPALMTVLRTRLFPDKAPVGPTCNCAICLVSSIAAVVLVAMTLHQWVVHDWSLMTWLGAGGAIAAGVTCGVMSRRRKCRAADTGDATDTQHE